MRIAQIAPLHESVPPKLYGGTERVVSYLTEELVALGHEVTLFASGDSTTRASLIPGCSVALRLANCLDPLSYHYLMLERVYQKAQHFDVLHFHCDYLHFPISRRLHLARVTTLHGRLDLPELQQLYREYSDEPVISISHSQQGPLPHARWVGNVYHGLPPDLLAFQEGPGQYLAFLGRVTPDKGVDRAIAIARRSGIPLRIAAKVDRTDLEYHSTVIKPLLADAGSLVEFVGEIGDAEKASFLGQALGLLFPIDWPEPFGLVMIEALACGTPVIAMRRGSVPEIVDHGVTGFIAEDVEGCVRAVSALSSLDRRNCRQVFERRFTARCMAQQYEQRYQDLAVTVQSSGTKRRAERNGGSDALPYLARPDARPTAYRSI